jgi:glucose-6-phosphate isomerase
MQSMSFSYKKTSLVSSDDLVRASQNLKPEIERIKEAIAGGGYHTPYASVNLLADEQLMQSVLALAQEKKALRPTALVVIGIGGSNLGTQAVHQALYGTFYNEQEPEIKVYFADTVDTDYIYDIILLIEQELEKDHNIILNVISKSGSTTETIANFELFLHLLKQAKKVDYQKYIVVTTDEGSRLWNFAQQEGCACLAIPEQVGGRYSVFSAVGLFPLALLGVDIAALRDGARSMLSGCTYDDIFNNPAALSAAILYTHYQAGVNIHDTFLFSVDFEGLGKWYRQLMGESIGKEITKDGQQMHVGITPTVSLGSTDLHSVAQLYLGGPYDKLTTFVSVEKNKSNVVLPQLERFENLVAKIQGKSLSSIMDAIEQGVRTAYYKNKRPFVSVVLPEKSAYSVGQFLQFKMIEMMYLGYMLGVNPFNQPQVELYKKETRKILGNE